MWEPDHGRLKALFGEVCDLPDRAQVQARLAELGALPEECAAVLRLLAHDDGHTTHLSGPVSQMLASAAGGELAPGDRLGAWTLVRELGEGGMGRVFEAQRSDGHYEQRSAIKVLRGFSSPLALAQLAHERQVLASLNHPHIARLLDGGTTPAGNPYLVMEHVDGQRIDEHVRRQGLGLAGVLSLFVMVCDAVAHAHRRLIVHCDIKPGNVLVDDQGSAKLLDFGIAQLEGRGNSELQALTPRYASPEQRAGAPATASTDIFSLGRTLGAMLEPLRQSPQGLPRAWELDALIEKATADEPAHRYAEVSALVADVERFRRHEPLQALSQRRPQVTYRLRKYVRRHWPWLGTGGVGVVLAAGFTVGLVQQRDLALRAQALAQQAEARAEASRAVAVREQALAAAAALEAQRERDAARAAERATDEQRRAALAAQARAQEEATLARQVSELTASLFRGSSPGSGARPDTKAMDLLDRGRERLAADTELPLTVRATMTGELARSYHGIGNPQMAVQMFREALRLERSLPVPRLLAQADLLGLLSASLVGMNRAAEAEPAARESLALREQTSPAGSLERAAAHHALGWVLVQTRRFDEAERHLEQAVKIRLARLGPTHPVLGQSLRLRGRLGMARERWDEALLRYRETLAVMRAAHEGDAAEVVQTELEMAIATGRSGRLAEGEQLMLQVLQRQQGRWGAESVFVAGARHHLATMQRQLGRLDEALANARGAVAVHERLGVKSTALVNRVELARIQTERGDPEAERLIQDVLAVRRQTLPETDLAVARSQQVLGEWLLRNDRPLDARPLLDAAWASFRAEMTPLESERLDAALLRAELAARLQDREALDRAVADLPPAAPSPAAVSAAARARLWHVQSLLAEARGEPALAVSNLQRSVALAAADLPPASPTTQRLRLELAEMLARHGQPDAAREALRALAAWRAGQHEASPLRQRAAALEARVALLAPQEPPRPDARKP